MRLRLKTKIILLAVFAVALPVFIMMGVVRHEKGPVIKGVNEELLELAYSNVAQIAVDAYALCDMANTLLDRRLVQGLDAAQALLAETGGLEAPAERQTWEVLYEQSGEKATLALPKLNWRGEYFPPTRDPAVPVPYVDDVRQLTGLDCDLFWRLNEQGDMLRVAGNIPGADGQRGTGLVIASQEVDGTHTPCIARVLEGRKYRQMVAVKGTIQWLEYAPVWGDNSDVVGMLCVSMPMQAMQILRETLMRIQVGKTGYVWVLGGKGEDKGIYILSKNGELDGVNLWNAKTEDGYLFVQSIVNRAVKLPARAVAHEVYSWRNKGETVTRDKVSAFTYFEPWDWVIGAGTYKDDYLDAQKRVDDLMNHLFRLQGANGLAVLVLVCLLAFLLGRGLVRPIERMAVVAEHLATGDLQQGRQELEGLAKLQAHRLFKDETHQLADAFERMVQALFELIRQVQKSGIQVTTSSTEIAASARQLEATVTEQAASIHEVSATSRQISATSQELATNMEQVAVMANDATRLASESQQGLRQMEGSMRTLMEATGGISTKLGTISEKTGSIEGIITTIAKIADQTNLLSLNAAIEAEKAGEYGVGFSVVAREIRRLADQTAVATLGIERMVKESHAAVSAGVMEMDQFIERVRQGIREVEGIGKSVETIIGHVQELAPRFSQALQGAQSQSAGAEQISLAMQQLNEAAMSTRNSLQEFSEVTRQLSDAVQGLRQGVAKFKTE